MREGMPYSLGVTESFKNRGRLKNELLDERLLLVGDVRSTVCLVHARSLEGEILQEKLGSFRLARSGLAADDDRTVSSVLHHRLIGYIGNSEDMRLHCAERFVVVALGHICCVNGLHTMKKSLASKSPALLKHF